MVEVLNGSWQTNMKPVRGFSYICGYCASKAGPSFKYTCEFAGKSAVSTYGDIYLCPLCNKPTFISKKGEEQIPGPLHGNEVEFLPEDVAHLFNEARRCFAVNAFTSSVLSCRKLLMNVSVTKGAEAGKRFAFYVTFLEENHFLPPNSKEWVDHIRKKGNEATHEIPSVNQVDAIELIEFTEMLLRFVYELPGKMEKYAVKST